MPNFGDKQEQEFVKLLVSHQSLIQAFIVSLLPGYSEADDVVQNTNEVLWQKRDTFEIGSNFKAWALTTARYQVMSVQQKLKRDKIVYLGEDACEAVYEEMQSRDVGETKEKLNYLNECIGLLQMKDQELVLHRYWKKAALDDYARNTGRTVEALRAALYRIRTSLRKCVKNKLLQGRGLKA